MSEVTKGTGKKIYKLTHIPGSNIEIKKKFEDFCKDYKFDQEDYLEVMDTLKDNRLSIAHIHSNDITAEEVKIYGSLFPDYKSKIEEMVDLLSMIRKKQNNSDFYKQRMK
jgi:hypothetical protein